jgi:hypothetical protein
MKTKTKALILALCAVLLVVSTVFATLAFLTASDTVTNTFTFGKVALVLDEAPVDADGTVIAGNRTKTNEYHLLPGHQYTKDPTVHITADSEECWVFVKVENDLEGILAAITIEQQMTDNGWVKLTGVTNATTAVNVWCYNTKVVPGTTVDTATRGTTDGVDLLVFDYFKLDDNADVSQYATTKDAQGNAIGGATIDIIAYAVQADGFGSAAAAWDATFGK